MSIIKILLQKEMLVFKNSHLKNREQIYFSLIQLILGLFAVIGIIWFLHGRINPLLTLLPPSEAKNIIIPTFLQLILLWGLFSSFSLMAYEIRTKFYLSSELSLLYSTPIPVATLFLSRFFLTICFSVANIIDMIIFSFIPLIVLGITAAASWQYYLFILPVLYLLRIIGSSIGGILSMLLIGIVPSKWLTRITVGLGFLSTVLWMGLFVFIGQMDVFLWVHHLIERVDHLLFPLTDAVYVLHFFILAEPMSALGPLARLFLTSGIILTGCALVAARIYHAGFDKSQTLDAHAGKQIRRPAKEPRFFRKESNIILVEWRKAIRNYEIAPGSVIFLGILFIYLFAAQGITLPKPWDGLLYLGHIGIMGFLIPAAINILFISMSDVSEDISVFVAKRYGLLKTSPLDGRLFMHCYWFAPFILQLLAATVIFILMNLFFGGNVLNVFLSVIIFALLAGSFGALATAGAIANCTQQRKTTNLINRFTRRILPFAYYIVALGILALGQIYTEFNFLGFLRHLPQGMVPIITGTIFLGLSAFTLYSSLRLGAKHWEEMEI